jgi:hypothetical protein
MLTRPTAFKLISWAVFGARFKVILGAFFRPSFRPVFDAIEK